jgi:hypothetical protein
VACAVDALERSGVQRIVLTRPAVEAGERLGFLPGDLAQKVDPYLRPLYDVEREVAQHAVGAGALEGQQRFHHHRVVVQPAVGGGGLEHRVLAADLVGEGGHAELVLHAAHDVQVRHAGLDHHHVGALGDVQRHLAQRLVAVARVHLVDLLVALAQVAGAAHRVAEGAVEALAYLAL